MSDDESCLKEKRSQNFIIDPDAAHHLSQEQADIRAKEIVIYFMNSFTNKSIKPNKIKKTKNIVSVPEEEQCSIPGCNRRKVLSKNLCSFHKCAKCDKRTHEKHGIYCKECDTTK